MILYLDTETLPRGTRAHLAAGLTLDDPPEGWECPPYPDPPVWDYTGAPAHWRDPAKIAEHRAKAEQRHAEALRDHEAGRAAWSATAQERAWADRRAWSLDPLRAEVACMSYALDDGAVQTVDGADVLDVLDAIAIGGRVRQIVAHNAGFDADLLWSIAMRTPGRRKLAGWLARWEYRSKAEFKLYGGPAWVDTMDLVAIRRSGSYRMGVSQRDLADLLGVGRAHDLRGGEVFDAWVSGRQDEVRQHCEADVTELREIHRILSASSAVRA